MNLLKRSFKTLSFLLVLFSFCFATIGNGKNYLEDKSGEFSSFFKSYCYEERLFFPLERKLCLDAEAIKNKSEKKADELGGEFSLEEYEVAYQLMGISYAEEIKGIFSISYGNMSQSYLLSCKAD